MEPIASTSPSAGVLFIFDIAGCFFDTMFGKLIWTKDGLGEAMNEDTFLHGHQDSNGTVCVIEGS